jgi:hypothetical protein
MNLVILRSTVSCNGALLLSLVVLSKACSSLCKSLSATVSGFENRREQ